MLSTAIDLLDATKNSIFDEDIMGLAGELHTRRNELSDEIFAKYLYMYSSALSAKVADSRNYPRGERINGKQPSL